MNASSSTSSLFRRTLPLISRRSIHAAPVSLSHIGSSPLQIPPSISLTLPVLSQPPTSKTPRNVSITGPLGTTHLPIPAPVILHPPTPENGNTLSLTVHDSTVASQRALWGLTRALLNNSIVGVSDGFRVVLRLVGVGYRAAVEPIPPLPFTLPAHAARFIHDNGRPPPTHRLNLKLGFALPVLLPIPSHITVTTPQPTRIVLSGTDNQSLGLFAAKIRRYRKPEPYRGKGIFVGDETIKLKEIKKK